MQTPKPALFLDRDGIIVEDKGYVYQVEDLILVPGIVELLKTAKSLGYYLIVITNQSGVARGYFRLEDVDRFHQALDLELWQQAQLKIDRYYICPHHPNGKVAPYNMECNCRKPATGLVEQALKDFAIDLEKSFFIGDKASDVDCGIRLRISTIQLDRGQYPLHSNPGKVVNKLAEAMDWIVKKHAARTIS